MQLGRDISEVMPRLINPEISTDREDEFGLLTFASASISWMLITIHDKMSQCPNVRQCATGTPPRMPTEELWGENPALDDDIFMALIEHAKKYTPKFEALTIRFPDGSERPRWWLESDQDWARLKARVAEYETQIAHDRD